VGGRNAWKDLTSSNIMAGVIFPRGEFSHIYRCPSDKSKVRNQPETRPHEELLSRFTPQTVVRRTPETAIDEINSYPEMPESIRACPRLDQAASSSSPTNMKKSSTAGVCVWKSLVAVNSPTAKWRVWWTIFPPTPNNNGCNASFADGMWATGVGKENGKSSASFEAFNNNACKCA